MHQELKTDLMEAMKAKDSFRLTVLRGLITALTNENVTKKQKPDTELSNEEVVAVLSRAAKQRKDSIEQYEKGGRSDLAEIEKRELALIETYLPVLMSRDEIIPVVLALKVKLGITDRSKLGMFMGAVMKELKGKADGNDVKAVVEEILK